MQFQLYIYTPFLADPAPIKKVFKPDRVVEKFTQYIELTNRPIQWPTRSRRAVVRAKKWGCQVRLGTAEDIPALLQIYHENCEAADILLKPDEYLYQVVNHLCPAGHCPLHRCRMGEQNCCLPYYTPGGGNCKLQCTVFEESRIVRYRQIPCWLMRQFIISRAMDISIGTGRLLRAENTQCMNLKTIGVLKRHHIKC